MCISIGSVPFPTKIRWNSVFNYNYLRTSTLRTYCFLLFSTTSSCLIVTLWVKRILHIIFILNMTVLDLYYTTLTFLMAITIIFIVIYLQKNYKCLIHIVKVKLWKINFLFRIRSEGILERQFKCNQVIAMAHMNEAVLYLVELLTDLLIFLSVHLMLHTNCMLPINNATYMFRKMCFSALFCVINKYGYDKPKSIYWH